jgi:NTE family protein
MMVKNSKTSRPKAKKTINLALQGGGAHGAFTWGVLDRLLEEEELEIEGISATSAGAMNAAIVSYGMITGREETRALLSRFWKEVSHHYIRLAPGMQSFFGEAAALFSPAALMVDYTSHLFSPYQMNLFDANPLRDILTDLIDFETLRKKGTIKLFINATNVRTGKIKIFFLDEITRDMLLASACPPEPPRGEEPPSPC